MCSPFLRTRLFTVPELSTFLLHKTPVAEPYLQRMAPDLRRQVDALRAARLAKENATKTQVNPQVSVLCVSF